MRSIQNSILTLILLTLIVTANPNLPTYNNQEVIVTIDDQLLATDTHLAKNRVMLENFYQQRQNRALWLTNNWKIKGTKVMQLLEYIKRDLTLNPHGYIRKRGKILTKNLEYRHSKQGLIALDIQLTSLYYDFLHHTIYGEIEWNRFQSHLNDLKSLGIDSNWVKYPLKFDIISLLSQENITDTLHHITPTGYGYQKLIDALRELYVIKWKGGWNRLPPFKRLKIGDSNPMVKNLRERLKFSKDYRWCKNANNGNKFDSCLEKAVKKFQKRHGLVADGVVGKGTQEFLNISVDTKIKKVLLNMDRIKWLPRQKSERYIIVNLPEYMLHYFEYGQEKKRLRVIIGDRKHPTPIFSDKISYITLNPYWKVPEGIVKREVIPKLLKNANYLKEQGLEAHTTWETNSSIVPLDNINWYDYAEGKEKFPYRLMQPPGPKNALGKIKFKFPNNFSVYLHDTPTKHLFKKKRRAFSHGCIRLSKPLSLLKSISYDPSIDFTEMNSILKGKEKRDIILTNRIPIHLVYLTTWVNEYGELIFGDDIYNYDSYQPRMVQ
jgi:murein L,D-transpeptidase YcbB/YkuD